MKFIVAVVMLALACSASATFFGLPNPLAYSAPVQYAYAPQISLSKGIASPLAYSAPLAYSTLPATPLALPATPLVQYAPASYVPASYAPASYSRASYVPASYAPASYVAHQARVVVAAAAPASYTAATRGATHIAELPGHVESVVSQNLAPAPGTL